MLSDAHCHPFDLKDHISLSDQQLNVLAAASSCDLEEFLYLEKLAKTSFTKRIQPCFAIHPQMPAFYRNKEKHEADFNEGTAKLQKKLELLEKLAEEKRIAAVGECGFDLFNADYKETETVQDGIFSAHLETALRYNLPVVLHVRRAMHKIFANIKKLCKCNTVVFHSWSGTYEEASSLLRRGINAYFSFGNAITLDHKKAIRSCALLPADRLLFETDAPFQPARGKTFSQWTDLIRIIETASSLRGENPKELEKIIENNFRKIFMQSP
jgi:TatD DNase family protein